MKKILGLDLGTNSIGAALINVPATIADFGKAGDIEWLGSRIIPMDGFVSSKTGKAIKENPVDSFSKGVGLSKAATRRQKRGSRRLKQRYVLRRTRLIKVFKALGWLPENFPENFKEEMRNNENFKFKISDFLPFSQETINEAKELLGVENKKGEIKLPEDWIVYYLRKKGLSQKLSFAELARVIYMMNQRRGFKSSRKDLKDEIVEEKKWVEILKIKSVEQVDEEQTKNKNYKFKITPYSERVQPWAVERKKKPEWEEKEFTFLITEKYKRQADGTLIFDKQLIPQLPKEDDWALCVTAQDNKIGSEFPGTYFFNGLVDSVKNKTDFKIRQYAVYRSKYKAELVAIWEKQLELNEELGKINSNQTILRKLAEILYPKQTELNKPKLAEILKNDLLHLISEDIIYYQRELKSQKNSKSECQYEKHKGIDGNNYGLKCAPKSSPEFQEFRIWQDIHNIKVLRKEGTEKRKLKNGEEKEFTVVDIDVTSNFIDDTVKENLFDLFDSSEKISQKQIFAVINKQNEIDETKHRINMFFDGKDSLQGNETKNYFRKIFRKTDYETEGEEILKDKEKLYHLWQISYSISLNDEEKAKQAIFKALAKNENKRKKAKKITFNFSENVVKAISETPEIENTKKYAAYSSKAINKLLPLMRCGKYWNENIIDEAIKNKVEKIKERLQDINYSVSNIKNISDDEIPQQILKSFINQPNFLSGLRTYQACYLVYDRHSERTNYTKYSDPKEFDIMKLLPNNSLKNPIVEQVVREALFVVKDLWQEYGQPDEIHIEVGRELKKNAKERQKATERTTSNAEERKRIKALLRELMNDEFEQYNENGDKETVRFETKPNPESLADIKKFSLWKDAAGVSYSEFEKKIKEEKIPKNQEIKKYALWLSQKCVSPYTGKIISLSKLFTAEYEIEHIMPRGLIKNDSLDNLVIAESNVNKEKGRELGAVFIANKNGGSIEKTKLLDYNSYVEHCKRIFKGAKLKNLLATEIPTDFIERQRNDMRYITRKISDLLYPVAKGNPNATTDAEKGGIIFTIGSITDELKQNWGLKKEWKKLMLPRFERLEKLNNTTYITQNKHDRNDIDINVPENEDLNLKRIDHRHHALDALIIAATTIEHIRYLNSLSAVDSDEELKEVKRSLVKGKIREFNLPWEEFTKNAKDKLQEMIVTFKSNNNVISKPFNRYLRWVLVDGKWEQKLDKQKSNKKWLAVRKSLFKEPQGTVYIKEIQSKELNNLKNILSVVKLQIERNKAQNTQKQNTASYIYDQDTREDFKDLIKLCGSDLEKIEQYLKQFLKRHKHLKDINGDPIRKVRIAVFTPYAAKRVTLDKSFDHKKIDKIPYGEKIRVLDDKKMTIPQILHEHLTEYENYTEKKKEIEKKDENLRTSEEIEFLNNNMPEPFSDEGLEALDKKIGMKIRKVTIKEDIGIKKSIQGKLIESDSNACFVFYENETTKERSDYTSISTYDLIQKKLKNEPILEQKENCRIIILQSNDLVYVPTKEEREKNVIDWSDKKHITERLWFVNDFSKYIIYFRPNRFAKAIISNEVDLKFEEKSKNTQGNFDHKTTSFEGIQIKEICIKVEIDRLGSIKPNVL
jgi:CRISPR-associated endonuclease Csn1